MQWLVAQGADIHTKDELGATALHAAAATGQLAAMQWLVGQGVDIHAKARGDCTALHTAALNGNVAVVAWLVMKQGVPLATRCCNGRDCT
jgi:ankyrin repeat protein